MKSRLHFKISSSGLLALLVLPVGLSRKPLSLLTIPSPTWARWGVAGRIAQRLKLIMQGGWPALRT